MNHEKRVCMKYFFLLVGLLMPFTAFSELIDLQLRGAGFYPEDHLMRRVYEDVSDEYELEIGFFRNPCFSPWFNISYFEEKGHSTCRKKHTEIISHSLSIGIKRYYSFRECCKPYFGVGIGAGYVKFYDRAFYVDKNISKWGPLIIAKSGVQCDLGCRFFIDLFADYSYNPINGGKCKKGIKTRDVNIGGLKFGLGIGYHFGGVIL